MNHQVGQPAAPAVAALRRCLQDPDLEVRSSAALALGSSLREDAELVVPALTRCIEDRESKVRNSAAVALSQSCLAKPNCSASAGCGWSGGLITGGSTTGVPESSILFSGAWAL